MFLPDTRVVQVCSFSLCETHNYTVNICMYVITLHLLHDLLPHIPQMPVCHCHVHHHIITCAKVSTTQMTLPYRDILCHMIRMGLDIEVNCAYIVRGQCKSTMLSQVCLRAEDEGSAATRVLCPEANGAKHCALAIHLVCPPPCVLYVVVCTRLNHQLIFISAECKKN